MSLLFSANFPSLLSIPLAVGLSFVGSLEAGNGHPGLYFRGLLTPVPSQASLSLRLLSQNLTRGKMSGPAWLGQEFPTVSTAGALSDELVSKEEGESNRHLLSLSPGIFWRKNHGFS